MKKRFLAVLLTLAMVFSLAPVAFAGNIQDSPNNGTVANYYAVTVTDGITITIDVTAGIDNNFTAEDNR